MNGAALVAYIVAITWAGIRGWSDRWASLADWLVAAGTLALALGTFALAFSARRAARESSQAARDARDALAASLKPQVHIVLSQFGESVEARAAVLGSLSPLGLAEALPATDVRLQFNSTGGKQDAAFMSHLQPNTSGKEAQQPPYLNVVIGEASEDWPPPEEGEHVTATVTFSDMRRVGPWTFAAPRTRVLSPSRT